MSTRHAHPLVRMHHTHPSPASNREPDREHNGWTSGKTDGWTSGLMGRRTDGGIQWADVWVNVWMHTICRVKKHREG